MARSDLVGGWPSARSSRLPALFVVCAALAVLLLLPDLALASGSGSFSPTGSMGVPREGAAAAPLPDGRVLVAGGFPGPLASAEVFNPATNGFSPVNPMGTPRQDATAALLPNGRVLVAGGYDGGSVVGSAEVFNPATNSFSPVNPMGTPREGPAAAPLPDGRVLVAGGFNGGDLGSAEIFDPATNSFSSAGIGSMVTPRDGAVAAPLPDGRVLVAGGHGSSPWLSSAEIFDPTTGNFTATNPMGTPRTRAAAAPLPDGRVLVVGGGNGPNSLDSAEVFDPATSTFSSAGIGTMGSLRLAPVAAKLRDGRVLVAGGRTTSPLASAEIFAATNSFTIAVKGTTLIVSVQASGKVSVSDAASPLSVSAAKKKRKLLLKPASDSGDPPTISIPLRLSKVAKSKLRERGRVTVRARISFTPEGGLANTQTAKLKIRGKSKKKK